MTTTSRTWGTGAVPLYAVVHGFKGHIISSQKFRTIYCKCVYNLVANAVLFVRVAEVGKVEGE